MTVSLQTEQVARRMMQVLVRQVHLQSQEPPSCIIGYLMSGNAIQLQVAERTIIVCERFISTKTQNRNHQHSAGAGYSHQQ
jgi:hypothetical protein